MAQTVQGPLGPQEIDPADEAEALRELFHLMACLSIGVIDFEAIGKHKGRSGATPGPMRDRVEGLKRCLREFSSRKRELEEAPIDPVTGKPQEGAVQGGSAQASQEPLSLREIYNSLPDEIKNLLRRIFPNLDDKLREEDEKTAEGSGEAGGQSIHPLQRGIPGQENQGSGALAAIMARALDRARVVDSQDDLSMPASAPIPSANPRVRSVFRS